MSVEVTFDTSQLDATIKRFGATLAESGAATRNAARSSARALRRTLARQLQSETGISTKVFRKRFKVFDSYDRRTGAWKVRAWFGTYPVDPIEAGAKQAGSTIVTSKGEVFPDAFFARVKGRTRVAQRYGPKAMIAGRYRQPLRFPKVQIHDRAMKAMRTAMGPAQAQFVEAFAKALRAQLMKSAGSSP